jgi:hypothetical protein
MNLPKKSKMAELFENNLLLSIFQKSDFLKKILFVGAQNTKKSWKNFFGKTQNGGFQQSYF